MYMYLVIHYYQHTAVNHSADMLSYIASVIVVDVAVIVLMRCWLKMHKRQFVSM